MAKLEQVQRYIRERLSEIAHVLPRCYKLTLIARNTDSVDAHIITTDDGLDDAVRAIAQTLESERKQAGRCPRCGAAKQDGEIRVCCM